MGTMGGWRKGDEVHTGGACHFSMVMSSCRSAAWCRSVMYLIAFLTMRFWKSGIRTACRWWGAPEPSVSPFATPI